MHYITEHSLVTAIVISKLKLMQRHCWRLWSPFFISVTMSLTSSAPYPIATLLFRARLPRRECRRFCSCGYKPADGRCSGWQGRRYTARAAPCYEALSLFSTLSSSYMMRALELCMTSFYLSTTSIIISLPSKFWKPKENGNKSYSMEALVASGSPKPIAVPLN